MLSDVLKTIDSRRQQSLSALREFLSIPSVSTKPDHKPHMARCTQWVVDRLTQAGFDAKAMPTGSPGDAGNPVVVAKNAHQSGRPTVLLYGHYDVQPPEPLEQWISPPFEPAVRDNAIYARGAVDDKGQVWAHINAILAWQRHGGVPVNLTLLIEGEEEIGSDHLDAFIRDNRELLKSDVAVISDTTQFARGVPAITYGLRGLVYMEVTVNAAGHDLHSGQFGGAAPNPAIELSRLLASLHDSQGRVNLSGFYDDVQPLSDVERAEWQKLPFDESGLIRDLSTPGLTGEAGYSVLERMWARPTCDINGLTSGYQGPGAKTIIPARASAKISMRLVPSQDPIKIRDAFARAMRERAPRYVTVDVQCHSHTAAVVVPRTGKAMQLAAEAIEIGFGKPPALMREGGSIPVVQTIKSILGIDTLLIGFGLPDDRAHSPNEKFDLDSLHGGSRTAAALYEKLSKLGHA